MYYGVSPIAGKIVVENTGDSLLSVTKLRVAFEEESPYRDETAPDMQMMNMAEMLDFLAYLDQFVEVAEDLVPPGDEVVEEVPVDPEQPVDPIDPGFSVDPEQPGETGEQTDGQSGETAQAPEKTLQEEWMEHLKEFHDWIQERKGENA